MLDVGALLITSSVGVLRQDVPLNIPLVVSDLLMPDNRLPDGSLCTMFVEPSPNHGHLVIQDSLFNGEIGKSLVELGARAMPLCFVYAPGPRTKTPAENRYWAQAGGDVNSMSLGPEVVLANELQIPCAALVVGHKYSHPDIDTVEHAQIADSLEEAKLAFQTIVTRWLSAAEPVMFKNVLFRF
jgi:5'-methylthioadenosine phosphorylase